MKAPKRSALLRAPEVLSDKQIHTECSVVKRSLATRQSIYHTRIEKWLASPMHHSMLDELCTYMQMDATPPVASRLPSVQKYQQ